jgi:hypothetical protein
LNKTLPRREISISGERDISDGRLKLIEAGTASEEGTIHRRTPVVIAGDESFGAAAGTAGNDGDGVPGFGDDIAELAILERSLHGVGVFYHLHLSLLVNQPAGSKPRP